MGVPGAMTNVAPPDAGTELEGQTAGQAEADLEGVTSRKTTRNYEIDRSVRHVKNQVGSIDRVSVAVVVNEKLLLPKNNVSQGADADNEGTEGQPAVVNEEADEVAKQEEVARLTMLVKGVIGFDEDRGDVVTVIATKFEPKKEVVTILQWYENEQLLDAIKSVALVLAFIAVVLAVIRPIVKSYLPEIDSTEEDDDLATRFKDGELSDEELELIELGDEESLEDIKAKLKPKKSTISADMLDTANTYDDKVALVRLLVAEDAGRVANVLKKMIRG